MTKEIVDRLIAHRARMIEFKRSLTVEYFNENGEHHAELSDHAKRAIEIEILNVQAFIAGYFYCNSDGKSGVFTKKYYSLK